MLQRKFSPGTNIFGMKYCLIFDKVRAIKMSRFESSRHFFLSYGIEISSGSCDIIWGLDFGEAQFSKYHLPLICPKTEKDNITLFRNMNFILYEIV